MSSNAANIKEQLHTLADQLEPGATWKDIENQVRFRRAVEEGLDAADSSEFASLQEVREVFARYGVDYEA